MSYHGCLGNVSSRSLDGYGNYPALSCRSSTPSNLVYSTDFCSPSTYQLNSSLYGGCQETCYEPKSCQKSCTVSGPWETSCYRPQTSVLGSWSGTTCNRSLGFGSRSCSSLGYGLRSCDSLGCGFNGFRPLGYGACSFPYTGYGFRLCHPTYFPFRSFQSSCYKPIYKSGFY
ncbi:keratin-associated protein 13-1-like [Echinops telfairi]|uniref:Keratin-associated protein n=1 Tax=Echinops telfairi TaxID=9371 RepID=A0ABM0J259_ECHTE|nr:keratin-associated protein 13-1-like [Echinops telfairi]